MPRLERWLIGGLLAATTAMVDRHRIAPPLHRAELLPAGDVRIRAVRAGRGDTTLLFLHGYGESLLGWRAMFDPLAERFRVVAVDLPGFGGSEKPDRPYTLSAGVARLSAFLDSAIRGPVIVVGHSMGGELAAGLGMARPDRIIGLALIAPGGEGIGFSGVLDSIGPFKAAALGSYLAARAFLLPIHDPAWLEESPRNRAYELTTDPAYRRAATRVLQDFDFRALRGRFGQLIQPVLLIWGSSDPVIPSRLAPVIQAQLKCGQRVTISGALHRPQVERPDAVQAAIEEWVGKWACPPSILP